MSSAPGAAPVLPGDELLPGADRVCTRSTLIAARPEAVWPWIAQLGQGRGGFYSYDRLENLLGCDIHSAEKVVAAWQDVAVGDAVHLHPDIALAVVAVEPGRVLTLRGGVPIGTVPPPYDFTWSFVLEDAPASSTRLLVRERYAYTRGWARWLIPPLTVVSWVMTRRMLSGIALRATPARPDHAAG